MKYNYSFRDVGDRTLVMDLPKEIECVSLFLIEIDHEFTKELLLESIDMLEKGETKEENFHGNGYAVRMKKEQTEVYFIFDHSIRCSIETSELKELIEIWWKEFLKFHSDKKDRILLTDEERDKIRQKLSSTPSV